MAESVESAESSFARRMFGTPLEPLDPQDPRTRPLQPADQIVTDAQGRRRFHGAFTGGFSAGYFNSVGTRDGWAPSHFKTSRKSRNKVEIRGKNDEKEEEDDEKDKRERGFGGQSIRDFMDDEDLGEFGFAFNKLGATKAFSTKNNDQSSSDVPKMSSGSAVLNQLLRPSEESVGSTLLRQMGWRPGQGIGARLSKTAKKRRKSAHNNMFSKAKGSNDKKENEEEEDFDLDQKYRDFLFAPDDIPQFVVQPKNNLCGLGYKGLERTLTTLSGSEQGDYVQDGIAKRGDSGHFSLFDPPSAPISKPRSKMRIRGQAFGVGAFEDEDEDIYNRDDMHNYDFELAPEINRENKNPDRRSSKRSSFPHETALVIGDEVIEGFVKALNNSINSISAKLKKRYAPPVIPKGWRPRTGPPSKSRFEPSIQLTTNNPTIAMRKALLEPSRTTTPTKSSTTSVPIKKPIATTTEAELRVLLASKRDELIRLASDKSVFKPFNKDEEKQRRYEKFVICLKNNMADALTLLQPREMSEFERENERVAFERAALLYTKSQNNVFSSRFVSAGSSEDVSDSHSLTRAITDAEKAAGMNMYGRLTHEEFEWHPCKMLCMRFNVKNPFPNDNSVGLKESGSNSDSIELFKSLTFETRSANNGDKEAKDNNREETNDDKKEDISSTIDQGSKLNRIEEPNGSSVPSEVRNMTRSATSDSTINAAKESLPSAERSVSPKALQKPSMELFKSIFVDSSSDSEEDSKAEKTASELDEGSQETTSKTTTSSNKKGGGLFAQVDFEALKTHIGKPESVSEIPRNPSSSKDTSRMRATDFFSKKDTSIPNKTDDSQDTFGPNRPPAAISSSNDSARKRVLSSSSSDEWVEKRSKKERKKKKKQGSKKDKKKQKKRKKEKKRRKERSKSGSSSDSE